MKFVKTNQGLVPLEDFLDIKADQLGYDSYEEMQEDGYCLTLADENLVIVEESDEEYEEPYDIDDDMGFDPYAGCYTYDCQRKGEYKNEAEFI